MPSNKKPITTKAKPLETRQISTVIISQSMPISQLGEPMPEKMENLSNILARVGAEDIRVLQTDEVASQSLGRDVEQIVVAKLERTEIERLMIGKPEHIHIEIPQRVDHAMVELPPTVMNPGIAVQSNGGFSTNIYVTGTDGGLANAEVFAYGPIWPQRGKTDKNGKVTLSFMEDDPSVISSLHIKPAEGYWSLQLNEPLLEIDGHHSISLKPMDIAEDQDFVGWGMRAIGVDRLPNDKLGQGVSIAVIDSGIPENHRDFPHVNDGADIIGDTANGWKWSGSHHGAHCAGVIGGALNSTGMRSVAPASKLYISRIFPNPDETNLVDAVVDAVKHGVDIISMSLGMPNDSEAVRCCIQAAKNAGVAVIAAAGNSSGRVLFPARMPEVLCVSAIGRWGTFPIDSSHAGQVTRDSHGNYYWVSQEGYFFARFSCFGPEVDVCGPGVAINSAVPPDGFQYLDGTSMACPHIAGAAALILAHNPDFSENGRFGARNADRVDALFAKIKSSCRDIPGLGGPERIGAGLIDVTEAIRPTN